MAPIFLTTGLTLRNEVRRYGKLALQDIASDEVFLFITNLLHLSIKKKAPAAWTEASEFLRLTFGEEDQSRSLERFLKYILKPLIVSPDNTINPMNTLTDAIVNFLGIEAIKGMFPRYASGNNLEIFLDATKEYLNSCLNEAKSNWPDFLKIMDGVDQIPLLTIHKSKGLEYDTVILLGLDDESWWNYSEKNQEGKATFFVSLSRAKQRIIFTHSKAENCRQKVSPLYDLLKKAGVTEIVHKDH
jgi:superfamily I DNA/RNA helicase